MNKKIKEILKPCPFCGGEACVRTSITTCTPQRPSTFVYCKKCHSTSAVFTDLNNDGTFLFDAIDAWNRRAGEEENNG